MSQKSDEKNAMDQLLFQNNRQAKSKLKVNEPQALKMPDKVFTDYPKEGGLSYKHYNNKVANIYLEKMKKFMKKEETESPELKIVRHMTPSQRTNQHKTTQQIVDGILAETKLQVNDIKKKKGSKPKKIGESKDTKTQSKRGRKKALEKVPNKKIREEKQQKKREKKCEENGNANKKNKARIDIRTLPLKVIVDQLGNRKVCGSSLNHRLYPNLLGNQEEFIKLYGQGKLTKNYFHFCSITPFDHRMLARILANIAPKQFYVAQEARFVMQGTNKSQMAENFYRNLYNSISELQYLKKILEFELNYSRKAMRRLRRTFYEPSIIKILREEENGSNYEGMTEQDIKQFEEMTQKQKRQIEDLKNKLNEEQREEEMIETIQEQIKYNSKGRKLHKTDFSIQNIQENPAELILKQLSSNNHYVSEKKADKLDSGRKFKIQDLNLEQIYNNNKFIKKQERYLPTGNRKNVMVQQERGSDYPGSESSRSSFDSKSQSSASSVDSIDIERKLKRKSKHDKYDQISNSDSYMRSSSSEDGSERADPDDLSIESGLNSGEESFIDEIVSSNQSKKEEFSPICIPEQIKKERDLISEQSYELSGMSDSP